MFALFFFLARKDVNRTQSRMKIAIIKVYIIEVQWVQVAGGP
jgi:hypothetical protein